MNDNDNDQRPDPKPRKHPQLWQSYLFWNELVEMRKRHTLRISSIQAGKTNYDEGIEATIMDTMAFDATIKNAKKMMVSYGENVGPIWDWLTSIRGLGEGGLAAQLLAQIDDISKSETVSSLWRFCGQAVFDGQAERNVKGEKAHYNKRLKSVCWLITDQFIKQQTSPYAEIYYAEKARQRELHPEKIKVNGKYKYNDGHLHNMALRKMGKIFLQHLWVQWREYEGLPVSNPYVHDILGHTKYTGPK